MRQKLTRHWRILGAGVVLLAAFAVAFFLRESAGRRGEAGPDTARPLPRGGALVTSVRSEPRTFNRYVSRDQVAEFLNLLTYERLVRINRASQELEPRLAASWTRSGDGLSFTVKLREGVRFSNGEPFTSADVLFSFRAAYDEKTGGALADALLVNRKRLVVSAPDPLTVVIRFPSRFAPGLRLLDNLPILPRHALEGALNAGTFAQAWGTGTPPSELAALGPFVLSEYRPGERLVLSRNPNFWRKGPAGETLPYLDTLTMEIVPDQNAELLRIQAGQVDFLPNEIRPEDYLPLKREADAGRLRLVDLGGGLDADAFWINLKPGAFAKDPRGAWLQRDELRRAISHAVDRKAFADTVFFGAGVPVYGPVTPANKNWYWVGTPATEFDRARAKRLLASIGLTDARGDGVLRDARGAAARFTLFTLRGNILERGAAVIRDQLGQIGLGVDVVTFDASTLAQHFVSGDFEAVFARANASDTDPALQPDFWFSSGSAHLWNIGARQPAFAWERRIDDLMARQIASDDPVERKALFDDVQRIFAEHLPALYFVAPRLYVAHRPGMAGLTPGLTRPQLMWNAEALAVTSAAAAR